MTRKFQMEAEDGYLLTSECKTPAALGKDYLGQPLSLADTTLLPPVSVGQDSEVLGPPLWKRSLTSEVDGGGH